MTTLKFTFDDGSEALAHYGKKGMRWGVWDENTQAKYASNPDLIGEFAKMLNQGGASINKALTDSKKQGMSPYELHNYNQSFQNEKTPLGAGTRLQQGGRALSDAQKNASNSIEDFKKNASNSIEDLKKNASKAYADFTRDPGKALATAGSNAGRAVSDVASQAQRALSEASGGAIESGKRFIDSLFGTSFSKQSQARVARNKRRASDRAEYEAGKRAEVSAARKRRSHVEKMGEVTAKDKARRERAMSAYKTRKAKEGFKKKAYATAARRRRTAADRQDRFNYAKEGFKKKAYASAARKRRTAADRQDRFNYAKEGYKKKAYATAARRRRDH